SSGPKYLRKVVLAIALSKGTTSALPRKPTWWLSPVAGSQSTMPRAHCGSRLRFAGNDVPPIIQMAWPSQWNQTGDSRGPCSELWARWAYSGRDRNSSRSKTGRLPAETLLSTIFIWHSPAGRVRHFGLDGLPAAERLSSLAGLAGRNVMSRKNVTLARSNAALLFGLLEYVVQNTSQLDASRDFGSYRSPRFLRISLACSFP